MEISAFISDLTFLRYLIPLFECLRVAVPDATLSLRYDRGIRKYNGLGVDRNWDTFRKIMADRSFILLTPAEALQECDVLFTVECVGAERFRAGRHFSIQHGFDYQASSRKVSPDTVYLVASEEYQSDLKRIHGYESVVPPLPVSMWALDEAVHQANLHLAKLGRKDEPVATVLYPEEGHRREARAVIADLTKRGCFVVVKQRRKSQRLPWLMKNKIYDDVWYPSESVYFPCVSAVTVGFGSTAFCDLVPAGLNYVDVRLPHPQYGLPSYVPIFAPSYHVIDEKDVARFPDVLDRIPLNAPRLPNARSRAENFIRKELVPLMASRFW